ncbi:hypothetical protein AB1K18_01435 [Peribacillus simplex]|uniref:hypothetical protein n=1 Tax=Peribacillus simplex TaxID=1478 RepID=UPI003B8B9071
MIPFSEISLKYYFKPTGARRGPIGHDKVQKWPHIVVVEPKFLNLGPEFQSEFQKGF